MNSKIQKLILTNKLHKKSNEHKETEKKGEAKGRGVRERRGRKRRKRKRATTKQDKEIQEQLSSMHYFI